MPWGIRYPVYNDPANMHLCYLSGSSVYLLIYLPAWFISPDTTDYLLSPIYSRSVFCSWQLLVRLKYHCAPGIVRDESSNSITRPICPPFLPSPSRWFILEIKDIIHPSRSVENSCSRRKLMHLSIVVGFLSSLVFHQSLLTIVSIHGMILRIAFNFYFPRKFAIA